MSRTKVPILSQIIIYFSTEPLYAVRPILEHVRTVVRAREVAQGQVPRAPRTSKHERVIVSEQVLKVAAKE